LDDLQELTVIAIKIITDIKTANFFITLQRIIFVFFTQRKTEFIKLTNKTYFYY